ncbi:hypothetical protein FQA39_LY12352 [Lamprigera yunnana]|nr:hypothetical protein FQA39_LY12352 [Lamprigera yunnana]
MKILLLIFLYIGLGSTQQIPSHLASSWTDIASPFSEICIVESKVDPVVVANVFQNVPVDVEQSLRCYFKCLGEKMGLLLPSQQYDAEKFSQLLPHLTKAQVYDCIDDHASKTDICLKAYLATNCIMGSSVS